ncbi:MAG TPA: hypothetical protein VHN14_31695 [Kofleriaceae bacterium]|nr:hypothetical protein [Kofleriaceae bacterium]
MIGHPVSQGDPQARYAEYLSRLTQEVGDIAVGDLANWSGRLIHKMSFDEFTAAFTEYTDLLARYRESLARGDTVDDLVLKLLREQATDLVMPPPAL